MSFVESSSKDARPEQHRAARDSFIAIPCLSAPSIKLARRNALARQRSGQLPIRVQVEITERSPPVDFLSLLTETESDQ